jgi:hypothetical protein
MLLSFERQGEREGEQRVNGTASKEDGKGDKGIESLG